MTAKGSSWQDNCPSVISRLAWLLHEYLHVDVHFVVGSVETWPYSAHKIILASGSPVFERMFYGSCPEITDPIRVPDVEPSGFNFMLKYFYEDHKAFQNELEVFYTLVAAKKYMIKNLEQLCHDSIKKMIITTENVWTILECTYYLKLEESVQNCLSFIEINAKQSFQNAEFFTTAENIIKIVLDRPLLRIKEVELLDFIAEWVEKQDTTLGISPQKVIHQFLPHIDILSIGKDEFSSFMERHNNIFTIEDKMAFMLNFSKPIQNSNWCLEGPRRGLTENISNFLVENGLKNSCYTSVISTFECQYRLAFDKHKYRDIQSLTLKWCNKTQDLPLLCDVTLSWGKDLSQTKANIEKRFPTEQISIDLERSLATVSSNFYTLKVRVEFKYFVRLCFLSCTKPKKLPVSCELQRAFGVTQWKKKIIFSKASCISNICMIRWKKLKP